MTGYALKELFLVLVVLFDLGLLASVIWRWIQVLPSFAADEDEFGEEALALDMTAQREAADAVRAVIRN